MKIWTTQCKNIFRNIIRNRLNISCFVALWLFAIIIFFPYYSEYKDALGMVQFTQYAQLTCMLFFLTLGVQLEQLESVNGCEDVVNCYSSRKIVEKLSKATILSLFALLLSICIYLALCVFYMSMGMTVAVYAYAMKMFALYFLFPCLICGVIGMILRMLIRSRTVWFAVLVTWLFVSPISAEATSYIFEILSSKSHYLEFVFSLLNLGGKFSIETVPVYGLPFEPAHMWKALVILMAALSLMIILSLKPKRVWRIGVITCTVSLFLLVAVGLHSSFGTYFVDYGAPKTKSRTYDSIYYYAKYNTESKVLSQESLPSFDMEKHLRPISHDMYLTIGLCRMKMSDTITCELLEKCTSQTFTLYHGYEVADITLGTQSLSFQQEGDYISVSLPNLEVGTRIALTFQYAGTSSPRFPATLGSIFLPGSYPWYPEPVYKIPSPIYGYNEIHASVLYEPIIWDTPVEYTLKSNVKEPAYCNLTEIDPGLYSGNSLDGITFLYNPLLKKDTIDGITLYYPASAESCINEIVECSSLRIKNLCALYVLLGTEFDAAPITYVVSPDSINFNNTSPALLNIRHSTNFLLYSDAPLIINTSSHSSEQLLWDCCFETVHSLFAESNMFIRLYSTPAYRLVYAGFTDWWLIQNGCTPFHSNYEMVVAELTSQRGAGAATAYTSPESVEALDKMSTLLSNANEETPSSLVPFYQWWYKSVSNGDTYSPEEILEVLLEAIR